MCLRCAKSDIGNVGALTAELSPVIDVAAGFEPATSRFEGEVTDIYGNSADIRA